MKQWKEAKTQRHRSQEPQGIPSSLGKDIAFPTGHGTKAPSGFYGRLPDSCTSADITAPYQDTASLAAVTSQLLL